MLCSINYEKMKATLFNERQHMRHDFHTVFKYGQLNKTKH